jgi:3',5'-cyclic-AMP phosphodiesterase
LAVRFVVFGDTKGKNNGINKRVLEKIMLQVKKLNPKPDFIVALGDTIGGSSDLEIHKSQMKDFKNFINSFMPGMVMLPVIGNHEVNNEPMDDTYERLISETYINFKQHGKLENYNNTAYYMDLEYCRFIVLNCYHNGQIKKVSNNQLEWFEKVSKVDKKFKIMFIHCPLFPTGAHLGTCLDQFQEYRDKLWSAIEKNKIDMILAGHEHNYSRRVLRGTCKDVYQIITGGGGEKLKDSFKCKNGVIVPPKAVYHFVVIDMNAESVMLKAVSIDGKIIDEFKIIK